MNIGAKRVDEGRRPPHPVTKTELKLALGVAEVKTYLPGNYLLPSLLYRVSGNTLKLFLLRHSTDLHLCWNKSLLKSTSTLLVDTSNSYSYLNECELIKSINGPSG